MPTSGSNIAGPIAAPAVDDREHRRRDDVGVPGGAGGLGSRCSGLVSPTASAYSLIFSRPTAYVTGG